MPLSRIDICPVTKDVLVRWNLRFPDPNLGNVSKSMVLVLEVTVSVNIIIKLLPPHTVLLDDVL